jgi:hypothetical protein
VNFLDWLLGKRPGTVTRTDDRIEIAHSHGDFSTIWVRRDGAASLPGQGDVAEFYKLYDGASLFSSTFKIAAIEEAKQRNGVKLAFSLKEIQEEFDRGKVVLPEPAVAFMYQAGIGIYCASTASEQIFEWDTETGEVSVFPSLVSIFEEWLDAAGDI